jgi:hypothetical protein
VVKKEAEELKKENDTLKKENDELKKKAKESEKIKDEANTVVNSMAENMRRYIPYDEYDKLRNYALKATKFYSEMKNNRNILQIQLQEMQTTARALKNAQMVQYQKDAKARAHVEELRQRNAEAKVLTEKNLREAKEVEFMRNVNHDVLEYYNDLIRMGENIDEHLRLQILSKRTIDEAQLFFLKAKRNAVPMTEAVQIRDLSAPIPVKNYRQVVPDSPIVLPKGFI